MRTSKSSAHGLPSRVFSAVRAVTLLILSVFVLFAAPLRGATSFRAEIAPLLQRHCATCHSEDNRKGKYRLDTFALLLKPGESDDPPIVAGKPQESELYQRLIESDPTDRMPQKADPLPDEEIARIEKWIAEGAHYDGTDPGQPIVELARQTLLHPAPEHYSRPMPVSALAFSPDGAQLAVSGYYELTLWNVADGTLARRVGGLPERITSLAWHPARNLLAAGGGTPGQWGAVALLDPSGSTPPHILCDLPETALCVAFNREGDLLAAGAGDRTVRFFDTTTGKPLRVLRQHADWVQTVAFNDDGSKLVTASRDRTSRIFNTTTGELEGSYTGHETPLLAALFSMDGRRVLSLDRSKDLQIWDIHSLQKVSELKEFHGEPRELLFWGNALVAGGTSPVVTVDQVENRSRLFTLLGHHDAVTALAVSPDETLLATGSADGEVLIWNLACGTWTLRFVATPR